MKLEEAIKYNEELKVGIDEDEMPNHHKAIQLGLEALKVLDLARFNSNGEWPPPLPGETEE